MRRQPPAGQTNEDDAVERGYARVLLRRGYLQEINDNEFVIRKGLNGQEPGLRKKFLKETELYAEDLNKSQHHRGGTGRRLRGIRISSVTNKRRVELRPYYDRGWSEKTSSNCRTS